MPLGATGLLTIIQLSLQLFPNEEKLLLYLLTVEFHLLVFKTLRFEANTRRTNELFISKSTALDTFRHRFSRTWWGDTSDAYARSGIQSFSFAGAFFTRILNTFYLQFACNSSSGFPRFQENSDRHVTDGD